jgi:hypothetical protein
MILLSCHAQASSHLLEVEVKKTNRKFVSRIAVLLVVTGIVGSSELVVAQDSELTVHKPATVEHYYRVKWGHFDEFYELFRRNHYPILKRLQKSGEIVEMSAAFPVHHAGEANRWDMRFTIVFANPKYVYEYVYGPDLVLELYPDQKLFKKEEQRRFALLLEHIDVPVRVDDLSDWSTD